VEYEVTEGDKGPQAANVKVIESAGKEQSGGYFY
jgi:hypothetical protein